MRPTPEIPEQFRRFNHRGYTNVFSLLPHCKRFYGTETLFGDWDGTTLLLGKDAAPTHVIRARVDKEGDAAWRHSERDRGDPGGWRTNDQLRKLAATLPGTQLYGSATANMLCDKRGWSGNLPSFYEGPLNAYFSDVLRWVIDSMPNLRAVACLGQHAWFLTATVLGSPDAARDARGYRNQQRLLVGKHAGRQIVVSCHLHPSRGSHEQRKLGWDVLAAHLRGCC